MDVRDRKLRSIERGRLGYNRPTVAATPQEQEQLLQQRWQQHGATKDYDFDNWKTWDNEVSGWNKAHPDRPMPSGDYKFGSNPDFEAYFDYKHLRDQKMPFPGVRKANAHFMDGNPGMAVGLSDAHVDKLLRDYGY